MVGRRNNMFQEYIYIYIKNIYVKHAQMTDSIELVGLPNISLIKPDNAPRSLIFMQHH